MNLIEGEGGLLQIYESSGLGIALIELSKLFISVVGQRQKGESQPIWEQNIFNHVRKAQRDRYAIFQIVWDFSTYEY